MNFVLCVCACACACVLSFLLAYLLACVCRLTRSAIPLFGRTERISISGVLSVCNSVADCKVMCLCGLNCIITGSLSTELQHRWHENTVHGTQTQSYSGPTLKPSILKPILPLRPSYNGKK